MNGNDPLAIFRIDYVDRNGQRRLFYVFPQPIENCARVPQREFLVRTTDAAPAGGHDRFFEFVLQGEAENWWRIEMIGQTSNYTEFEACGLPDEVILAVARRFHLRICSSTFEEFQMPKAKKVWERLKQRFEAQSGDFRVEEAAGRFWLIPIERERPR